MREFTELADAAAAGDPRASAELLPLVYAELRTLAAARMTAEPPGQTLDATALVHEAYVRLVGPAGGGRWDGRGHFFAAAAEAMRRILVDAARRKRTVKHGGGRHRQPLIDHHPAPASPGDDILALDAALIRLAAEDPVAARVAELRRFSGASHEQAAAALGLSVYEARRKWAYARAWLRDALTG